MSEKKGSIGSLTLGGRNRVLLFVRPAEGVVLRVVELADLGAGRRAREIFRRRVRRTIKITRRRVPWWAASGLFFSLLGRSPRSGDG